MAIDLSRLTNGVNLPPELSKEILGQATSTSAVMAASRKIEMAGTGVAISTLMGGATAYWVNETDAITTSKPSIGTKVVRPYKMGVIIPLSRELVRDAGSLYDALLADLPSALAKKFDQTVAGTVAPGSNFDVLGGADPVVVATGADVPDVIDALADEDADLSAWVAGAKLGAKLATATDASGRPMFNPGYGEASVSTVFGAPIYKAKGLPVLGLAGDFAGNSVYGIVDGLSIALSTDATLTEGSETINLFERDMVAIRATMEVGFRVGDINKFVKITSA